MLRSSYWITNKSGDKSERRKKRKIPQKRRKRNKKRDKEELLLIKKEKRSTRQILTTNYYHYQRLANAHVPITFRRNPGLSSVRSSVLPAPVASGASFARWPSRILACILGIQSYLSIRPFVHSSIHPSARPSAQPRQVSRHLLSPP